jgi:Cu(I)/Ag(I) efflux system membrane fusion protein
MTERNVGKTLRGLAPSGLRGFVVLALVFVVAFVLGGLIFGGGGGDVTTGGAGHDQTAEVASTPSVWTCSMHPQIKLPKAGKCPICFMDLIPLETGPGNSELGPRQLRLSESARQLARIQTAPATRAFAEAEVRMVGKVAYDETKLAYITAWVPGRLDRLFADFTGVAVQKGDHLVEMYSPELVAAQEELIQASTAVTALSNASSPVLRSTAQATVDASRDKLRLFGLTAAQIERIEETRQTTDHLTIYAPVGGVVVHKDAKEGMYVTTGTRIYTIADLTKLWVMFEAYESDLPWLRYGQHMNFTSPSFPGELFEAVITFIDPLVDPKTRTVKVRAVLENRNMRLKPDMFVSGVVRSRLDGAGNIIDKSLAGRWIGPMHPEIIKNGPGQCDLCGMDLVPAESLGYVEGSTSIEDAPLLIPASAPLITGKRAVVYVEIPNEEGPLFEGREVELGPRAGDFYVVKSGVEEGELIVLNGAFKIDSELQIQAKPSMMSPSGGAGPAGHQHGGGMKPSSTEPGLSKDAPAMVTKQEEEPEVRAALSPVYAAYFDVQMALATDDLAGARKAGAALADNAEGVDMSIFSRAGHDRWMALAKELHKQAGRVAAAEDIKTARDGFFFLSKSIIGAHESFGHSDGAFYLTHCPMARDGDGAYWLQKEDVVWNSFYGESMQHCGSIEETLEAESGGDS